MKALPVVPNARARRIFLARHALSDAPRGTGRGEDLRQLIGRLGFIQIDSIATVERAHHMILFARRQSYRPEHLTPLLERDRHLWEHWTHDAAILPVEHFSHWQHRFQHNRDTLVRRWTGWQQPGFEKEFDRVLDHIGAYGPVSAADLRDDTPRANGGWWDWHPSKAALEYLWHTGQLAISRRDSFRKVYDLTERVIPAQHRDLQPDRQDTIDWACRTALDRLGFGTATELAAFWKLISPAEAKDWCQAAHARGALAEAEIEGHIRCNAPRRRVYLWPETLTEVPPEPPGRLRVLSPFDPLLRDRNRAAFLFGFTYRIEIYVPEPKRQYGYYVFPLLEGDAFIGRLDAKAYRAENCLRVRALWLEPGTKLGVQRRQRLEAELQRLARFSGCDTVAFLDNWQRS